MNDAVRFRHDILTRLRESSGLLEQARSVLPPGGGYAPELDDLEQRLGAAIRGLEANEMRVAVISTTNAGKSTMINALAGHTLLPDRDGPMTTLPVELLLDPTCDSPRLRLGRGLVERGNELLPRLGDISNRPGIEEAAARYGIKDDHVEAAIRLRLPTADITGPADISGTLRQLNDAERLLRHVLGDSGSLHAVTVEALPRIHTPPPSRLAYPAEAGNLLFIDTPGGSEHLGFGANLRDILGRSEGVLLVLDYTKLALPDYEDLKEEIDRPLQYIDGANFFIVVNKVDERRPRTGLDDEEIVRRLERLLPDFKGEIRDRLLLVAAIKAHVVAAWESSDRATLGADGRLSSSAVSMIAERMSTEEDRQDEIEHLLGLAEDERVESLARAADRLWRSSRFDRFIQSVVNSTAETVLPRLVKGAIKSDHEALNRLVKLLRLYRRGLQADLKNVEEASAAVATQISALERSQADIERTVSNRLDKLMESLKPILDESSVIGSENLRDEFEDMREVDASLKGKFKEFFLGAKPSTVVELHDAKDAKGVAEALVNKVTAIVQSALHRATGNANLELGRTAEEVDNEIKRRVQELQGSLEARLEELLEVKLPRSGLDSGRIPRVALSDETEFVKEHTSTRTTKRKELRWLWRKLWFDKSKWTNWVMVKTEEDKVEVTTYKLHLEDFRNLMTDAASQGLANLKQSAEKHLDQHVRPRVATYFDLLRLTLGRLERQLNDTLAERANQKQLSISMLEHLEMVERDVDSAIKTHSEFGVCALQAFDLPQEGAS